MLKCAFFVCTNAMALAISPPALAQTLDMLPPPRILSTSPHGVSIAKGAFNESEKLLSVVSAADDLDFTVSYSSNADIKSPFNILPKKWTHSWNVYVYNRAIDKSTGPKPSSWICEWYVVAGPRMLDKFQTVGCGIAGLATRYDDEYTGADLVGSAGKIRYEMKDGSVILFSQTIAGQGWFRAESWLNADGTGYTFTYDSSARLKLLAGTRGNALLFDYTTGLAKVCALRLAVDYASIASSCPTGAISASLDPAMLSVMDANGATTSFTYVSGLQAPNSNMISCIGKTMHSGCVISNFWQDANYIGADNRVSTQLMEDGTQVQ